MTAEQWLNKNFGSGDDFCPMAGYTASRQFFLGVFGRVLENALADETSAYDALMNVEGGTRGWELYFDDWKEKGILT